MQTATEIRKAFLDFFQAKDHLLVPSSSLIPAPEHAGMTTLLLTSAGMVQFKPYFTGEMTPQQPRLTSVQKCFRVQDIDEVGDASHLTFFEMLGNFSVGDYFKKEAIAWGWEFVTQYMKLPPERLWATVFRDDDEAYAMWQQTGVPARRIRRFEEKDNFWGPAGDEGPCGPCSEIHYDFGGKCRLGKPDSECGPNCECGRFLELWNLVFMQFYGVRPQVVGVGSIVDIRAGDKVRFSYDPETLFARLVLVNQTEEVHLLNPQANVSGTVESVNPNAQQFTAIPRGRQHERLVLNTDFMRNLKPLPRPNIDTGMGLERAALILQDKASIYETDLFVPIVQRVCELANKTYGQDAETDRAIRVVAEHARSAAFLIADGVVPDNKGRGYVLRRLIRRAIRFGRKLGLRDRPLTSSGRTEQDFAVRGEPVEPRGVLAQVAEVVISQMGNAYPELASGREFILRVLQLEEERFDKVFERGSGLLSGMIVWRGENNKAFNTAVAFFRSNPGHITDNEFLEVMPSGLTLPTRPSEFLEENEPEARDAEGEGHNQARIAFWNLCVETTGDTRAVHMMAFPRRISGREAFYLYDTYGFPVELTAEIAREHDLEVDMEGFQREMEAQRQRARAAGGFGTGLDAVRVYQELGVGGTRFLGYERLSAESVVVAILVDGVSVDRAEEGSQVEVVLRETPFYAEGGGQAGDTGFIEAPGWYVQVEDTQSPIAGLIVHRGRVVRGTAQLGEMVTATVDRERRMDCARNHTATHLLHAALRQVLGTHVRQQGSLVAPDRLRFDFTHVSPLTPEELRQVETLVNDRIRANVPVHKRETTYRQAVAEGALAFFGERYGDRVRVVEVPSTHSHEGSVRGELVEPRVESRPSTSSGRTETLSAHGEPVEPRAESRPSTGSGRTEEKSVHGEPVEPRTDTPKPFSMEVCGGTHVDATGEIGYCHVLGESSVGAGLRRIEAVTGRAAEAWVRKNDELLKKIAIFLETSTDGILSKLTALAEERVDYRNRLRKYEHGSLRDQAQEIWERLHTSVNGVTVISSRVTVNAADELREMGDWLRDKLGSGVVVLGAVVNERPTLLVMVTKDLVVRGLHAGNVVKEAAKVMGGGGGGRPEMAQAGGRDAAKLGEALGTAVEAVKQQASKATPEH